MKEGTSWPLVGGLAPLEGVVSQRLRIFISHYRARRRGEWRERGTREVPVFGEGARWGNWRRFQQDPLELLGAAQAACGDVVRIPVMYNDLYLAHDPAILREVLIEAPAAFARGISHVQLRGVLGDGLLTAEFDAWVAQRRAAAPSFSSAGLEGLEATTRRCCGRWIDRWLAAGRRGESVVLADELMAMATQVAAHHFFGAALPDEAALRFVRDFVRVQVDAYRRLTAPWALDPRVIGARRRLATMAASLAEGAPAGLMGQAMTLVATAPENPSNALAWILLLLGRHPEAAARASLAARTGEPRYLGAVIHEALRMYPGGWAFERTALEDRVIGGYFIPAGAMLVISPYLLHRDPRRWADPELFKPERFLAGQGSPRDLPPFSYMPFSAGPRRCTGDRYTEVVLSTALREILARTRLELAPEERGEPWPLFTLRPRSGVRARLRGAEATFSSECVS